MVAAESNCSQPLSGGRAKGKKILTGIAVEIHEPKGYGRCRIAPLSDASSASLHAFVSDHVEPGATVITDGWQGYRELDKLGYCHEARSQRATRARGEDPAKLLCPRCIGSPHWPSDGCWALIKDRPMTRTFPAI